MQRKICSALSNAAQGVREKAAAANLGGEVGRADQVLKCRDREPPGNAPHQQGGAEFVGLRSCDVSSGLDALPIIAGARSACARRAMPWRPCFSRGAAASRRIGREHDEAASAPRPHRCGVFELGALCDGRHFCRVRQPAPAFLVCIAQWRKNDELCHLYCWPGCRHRCGTRLSGTSLVRKHWKA